MGKVKATITSTRGIMHLAANANGREQSVEIDRIKESIDPDGKHMLYQSSPLEPGILRTQWYIRLRDSDDPVPIWMDIDDKAFKEVRTIIELDVPDDI